jgi:hypothetical protein
MMNKKIEIILFPCIAIFVYYLGEKLLQALGGTISYLVFIPIYAYLSNTQKRFNLEFTLLNCILFLILLLNYLNFLNVEKTIFIPTVIKIFYLLYGIILLCFFIIINRNFNYSYSSIPSEILSILRKNAKFIISNSIVISLLYPFGVSIDFIVAFEKMGVEFPYSNNIVSILFGIFLVCLIYPIIKLRKIQKSHLMIVFGKEGEKNSDFGINNFKIKYLLFISILILLGTLIETQRNEWLTWIETVLIIIFSHAIIFFLINHSGPPDVNLVESVKDVKSLSTPQSFFIFTILHGIISAIVFLGFLFFLAFSF